MGRAPQWLQDPMLVSYIQSLPKTRIVAADPAGRRGVLGARALGVREATSTTVTFMDSMSEVRVNDNVSLSLSLSLSLSHSHSLSPSSIYLFYFYNFVSYINCRTLIGVPQELALYYYPI